MRRPLNWIVAGIPLLFMGLGACTSGSLPDASGPAAGMREWIEGDQPERVRIAAELEGLLHRGQDPAIFTRGTVPLGAVPLGVYSMPDAAAGDADLPLGITPGSTEEDRRAL
jgi:hypothetical protein